MCLLCTQTTHTYIAYTHNYPCLTPYFLYPPTLYPSSFSVLNGADGTVHNSDARDIITQKKKLNGIF